MSETRSAPGQLAAVFSASRLWSLMICCDIPVLLSVSVGGSGRGLCRCVGWLLRGPGWEGELRRLRGLGGQEQGGQEGPGGGDTAGDQSADGEAAQERVGGGMLQCQSQGRIAQGGDLAGGQVR